MAELESTLAGPLLLAIRWFVVLRLQPHWSLALGRLWWPVAAALALGLAASARTAPLGFESLSQWALAITAEVVLGASMGIFASLPAYALLGGATASAAAMRTIPPPFVRLCVSGALVAALSLQLHHPALVVLHDQAAVLPPGQAARWLVPDLPGMLVVQLDGMLMLALTLATPVLLSVVVVRSVVALVGAGPAVAKPFADALGPALATLGALLAFAASWSVYPIGWARSAMSVAAG